MISAWIHPGMHVYSGHACQGCFCFADKCIALLNYATSTRNKMDTLSNAELQLSAPAAGAGLFNTHHPGVLYCLS